jgi:hypothetical protein
MVDRLRTAFLPSDPESGAWAEDGLDLAVEVGGRLAGAVQAVGRCYRLPPRVYELGIELFDEGDRGRGLGGQVIGRFVARVLRMMRSVSRVAHTSRTRR